MHCIAIQVSPQNSNLVAWIHITLCLFESLVRKHKFLQSITLGGERYIKCFLLIQGLPVAIINLPNFLPKLRPGALWKHVIIKTHVYMKKKNNYFGFERKLTLFFKRKIIFPYNCFRNLIKAPFWNKSMIKTEKNKW